MIKKDDFPLLEVHIKKNNTNRMNMNKTKQIWLSFKG